MSREQLLILIQSHTRGQAIDRLPLSGRRHNELMGINDPVLCLRSNLHVAFAVRDFPGLSHREMVTIKRNGSRISGPCDHQRHS